MANVVRKTTVVFSDETRQTLEHMAEAEETGVGTIIRRAVREFLDRQERIAKAGL